MKPSAVAFLFALISFPVGAFLIHWTWASWAAPILGVSLPWPQAFAIAFLTTGSVQVVVLLETIADMMWEDRQSRAKVDKDREEKVWDSPLV